jgi:uncharacterized protein YndB with AHSA1/START domain
MSGPGELEIRRRLPAPVAEVFGWWTQSDKLRQWMSPVGLAEADIDLRVGGALRIVMTSGDVRIRHEGEFIEIDAPRRLVFTWVSPYTGPEPSLVTIELEPDGEDATQLRLVHSRLPADVATSHRDGWGTMLDRLARLLGVRETEGARWPSTS